MIHKRSKTGKKVALSFLKELNQEYGSEIRNNGLILVSSKKQRGGYGICKTFDPYILIEPFFGSNKEAEKFKDKEKFARFLVDFIERS